jgi:hypothetical protein
MVRGALLPLYTGAKADGHGRIGVAIALAAREALGVYLQRVFARTRNAPDRRALV